LQVPEILLQVYVLEKLQMKVNVLDVVGFIFILSSSDEIWVLDVWVVPMLQPPGEWELD
jgi:hypothetical protein